MKLGKQFTLIACLQLFIVSCATANAEKNVTATVTASEQSAEVAVAQGSAQENSEESSGSVGMGSVGMGAVGVESSKTPAVKEATLQIAANATTSAVMSDQQEFEIRLEALTTMQGKFTQNLLDQFGKSLQRTNGNFKILRPGYFYWEVAPPYQQIVVGTPTSLKIYDPDLEQMTVQESASLSGTPAAFMSGESSTIFTEYALAKTLKEKVVDYTFSLKPKSNASFTKIQFIFDRTNKSTPVLSYLAFVDKLGQETQVQLSDVVVNKTLRKDAFQFVPPEGTDVIVDG